MTLVRRTIKAWVDNAGEPPDDAAVVWDAESGRWIVEPVAQVGTVADGAITNAKVAVNAEIAQSKISGLIGDLAAKATPAQIDAAIAALSGTYAEMIALAGNPDLLIAGAITRDANDAATSAPVQWPNGQPGTYTATSVSTAFPGAVDAYTITYGSPVTRTYTQPAVTRNANGAVTTRPAITVA